MDNNICDSDGCTQNAVHFFDLADVGKVCYCDIHRKQHIILEDEVVDVYDDSDVCNDSEENSESTYTPTINLPHN